MSRSEWGGERAGRTWSGACTAAAILAVVLGVTPRAYGEPITYKEVIKSAGGATGVSPSGSLGAVKFGGTNGDAILVLRFEGDTTDVSTFTTPVNGAENLVGVASVEVKDAKTGAVLARGDFINSDGIFVSADNTNGGVGFGSGGVPPGPGFPGQPAYPYAIADLTPGGPIDLKTEITVTGTFVASCFNFPVAVASDCGAPQPLHTTAGDLLVNVALGTGTQVGRFSVRRGEEACRDEHEHDEHKHHDRAHDHGDDDD
jgi:hypothetical protein